MSLELTHLFSKAACREPEGQQSRVIHFSTNYMASKPVSGIVFCDTEANAQEAFVEGTE
jgi:hypothetical protein